MDYRMPSYYNEFKCIADKCPATCCAGWAIVIDDNTLKKYNALQGSHGEFVRGNVDFKEQIFKRNGEDCAFLNKNGLCDLITKMGDEMLCNTCRRYPRHFEEYGNLVEAALSISCPVAAKMIIDNPAKDKFLIRHIDKISPREKEVDPYLLETLLFVRKKLFEIMSDRDISINARLEKVISVGESIQPSIYKYSRLGLKAKIKKHRDEILDKVKEKCTTSHNNKMRNMIARAKALHESLPEVQEKQGDRQGLMNSFMDMLLGLENINSDWPELIEDIKSTLYQNVTVEEYNRLSMEFEAYMKDREYEYEHIMNYFLYTYFLGGVYDYNVQAMVKMSLLSTLIIREMGLAHWIKNNKEFCVEDNIRMSYLYSRQLEHSDDNLMSLEGLLVAHPIFSAYNLLKAI
ncbi:MAG: flagellin lysine-N-methylase [Lachnospiraceae bacterium]|nr:flagellin lysine-N-methylase [Lachnospiraceae bacterium]